MKLSLNYLLRFLKSDDIVRTRGILSQSSYKGVKLLYKKLDELNEGFLYVGRTSYLPKPPLAEGSALIVIDDCAYPFDKTGASVIVLKEICDIYAVFDMVQNVFSVHFDLADSSATLLNALIKGRGLKNIIDICFEVLQNPVSLYSVGDGLINYASGRAELMLGDEAEPRILSLLAGEQIAQRIISSPLPIVIDLGEQTRMRRIIGKITNSGKIVGYLIVSEKNKNFAAQDVSVVAVVCEAISSQMQNSSIYASFSGILSEFFLADIIEHGVSSREMLDDWLRRENLLDCREFYILAVENDDVYSDRIEKCRAKIGRMLPKLRSLYYEHYMFALVCINDADSAQKNGAAIEKCLSDFSLSGGIGTSFSDLSEIAEGVRTAECALELGEAVEAGVVLHEYNKLSVYELINSAAESADTARFIPVELKRLIAHDRENGTDYCDTLSIYLKCAGDKAKAAKEMFVHRNTIAYRMDRISEIIGADLTDGEVQLRIHIGFKILNLGGTMKEKLHEIQKR